MKHETLYLLPPLITLVSSSVHAQQTPEDTKKQPNVIIILQMTWVMAILNVMEPAAYRPQT